MKLSQTAKRLGTVLFAALVLSGCVTAPYVRINAIQPLPQSGPPTLPAAIQHAEAVQDLYRDKLIELGEAERRLSTGLIALGGVMLGLGVGRAHHSAIEGVAIAGGTTYTAGVFTTDKRRAAVYGAGLEAVNCAVAAVSPLNLGAETLADIRTRRGDAGSGRTEVMLAAGRVSALLASMPPQKSGSAGELAVKAAKQAITAANTALANSTNAAADGDNLIHRYEQAGGDLRNAVKTIDNQVLNAMRTLEVDLRAVPDALSKLMDHTRLFSSLATSAASASPSFVARGGTDDDNKALDAASNQLDAATFDLQVKVAAMEHQTQRLTRLVKAVSAGMQDNVRACKVQLPFFVMSVSTDTVTFPSGVAGTQTVYVTGGQPIPSSAFAPTTTFVYTAEFVGSPHTGLSLQKDGRRVLISANTSTVAGIYPVRLEDATGGGVQTVAVVVGPAATSPLDVASAKAKLDPLKGTELTVTSVTNGKVKLVSFDIAGAKLDVKYSKVSGAVTNDHVKSQMLLRPELSGFSPGDLTTTLVP